ncbi:hypothetical protein KP509_26G002600 [Ceratopteris richardii]|uniref:Phenolic acid decarboxylase n=1 Tax=Ceratopteris richardii TaxID=49495 RepID=A0A8T2RHK7_CERRI|nr:hypothetical protein KP509_26G002600 [Ceratopteris richardii]
MSVEAATAPADPFEEPVSDLSGLLGKHIMYTYTNGWSYELYYKNSETIDYHVRSGPIQGRMVKGQKATIKRFKTARRSHGSPVYMVSWVEPTGTCVTQVLNVHDLEVNTTIFFPDWVMKEPQKTVCFLNDHLDEIHGYRNRGPTYPIHPKVMFGKMFFVEDCPLNDENIINLHTPTPMR